ncbi:MAG: uracil phosphoribosyltransferase [Holophagaceae bacterium]|nr:uracil phosphoribosyltransferase [Holophagaceae bacterium]
MNTTVLAHPLVHHKLTMLRSKSTSTALFRALVEEIGLILAIEATAHLRVETTSVETPLETCDGWRLSGADPVLVPVLRAGLGLVPPFLHLLPTAKVGHIGLARDHATLLPRAYYRNFPPDMASRPAIILDPMLATGGSAAEAVRQVKEAGSTNLTLACVIAAPEGIRFLQEAHPGIRIVAAGLDRELNEKGYILPGLGDAGDRIFGTR